MWNYGLGILLGIALLASAVPLVARLRHPDQKPLAAYLIFTSILVVTALVLFNAFGWLAGTFGLISAPVSTGQYLGIMVLALVPAFALAIWQTRKPPVRRGPPN